MTPQRLLPYAPKRKRQASYYEIMQREKASQNLSFSDNLREMHDSTDGVEASFASKLIATLDSDTPIWDRLVLEKFGFKLKGSNAHVKLENAFGVYESIVN